MFCPTGTGNIQGGTLKFELTLKGASWLAELQKLGMLHGATLEPKSELPVALQVGAAKHKS